MCQFSFISTATELHPRNASKLWAYLIPTPANLLIYKESGYNLKVRGSNPLPATKIKQMAFCFNSLGDCSKLVTWKIVFVIRFSELCPLNFLAEILTQSIPWVAYSELICH